MNTKRKEGLARKKRAEERKLPQPKKHSPLATEKIRVRHWEVLLSGRLRLVLADLKKHPNQPVTGRQVGKRLGVAEETANGYLRDLFRILLKKKPAHELPVIIKSKNRSGVVRFTYVE